jgi:hypothetical protein
VNLKRIVEWFAAAAGIGLAGLIGLWVWWQIELPGDAEYLVANRLTRAAEHVSTYPNQQVLFRARRGEVDLNAYGFMDAASQERLLAVLRTNMTANPTKVRVAFYPPRVMRETIINGQTFSVLEKTSLFREVKLN